MLADDELGASRESPLEALPRSYYEAFAAIDRDPNNELLVLEREGAVAAFLQLTFIPCLTHQGGSRALIEGVRVRSDLRGQGVGAKLLAHAIELSRAHGCRLVQLTTNKKRSESIRFYEQLGFQATHEGFKLDLDVPAA